MKIAFRIFAQMAGLLFSLIALIIPFFDRYIEFNTAMHRGVALLLWWFMRIFLWLVITAAVYFLNHK